jgi:DNA repair exonuclease SbcCD nuclease subunit
MATARFLHAADLHLGAPLKSLGTRVDEPTIGRITQRVNTAFDRLVGVAVDEQVDFVVLAGDVYDMADRDPGARIRMLRGLTRLNDEGIKVFIVHGNHDPLLRDVGTGSLPDNVVVFPAGRAEQHVVPMRNGAEVVVAGTSYGRKEEADSLVPLFADLRGRTIVGVLHTNVGGDDQHGNYAPTSVAELESSPVHYWALGHIHLRSVNRTAKGWWAYPGNLQGRSTKASECGPKGVLLVEVDADGTVLEPRFVDCAPVRFQRIEVPVDELHDVESVHLAAIASLHDAVAASEGVPLLVRLELTGTTPADLSALRDRESTGWASFESAFREEAADVLGDGALVAMRTSCRPRLDLAHERESATLLGAVLRSLDTAGADESVRAAAEKLLVNVLGTDR